MKDKHLRLSYITGWQSIKEFQKICEAIADRLLISWPVADKAIASTDSVGILADDSTDV